MRLAFLLLLLVVPLPVLAGHGLYPIPMAYQGGSAPSFTMPYGSQCLYLTSSGSDNSANYTTESVIADNRTTIYIRDMIKFNIGTNPSADRIVRLIRVDGTRAGYNGISAIYDYSDNKWYLALTYYNETSGQISSMYEYTLGDVVIVEAKFASNSYEFIVNGTTIGSGTPTLYADFDGITLGGKITGNTISTYSVDMYLNPTMYHDCVDVSSSGFLGTDCSSTGNLLNETFEGTGYSNSSGWAETVGTSDTINEDSTGP